MRDPIAPFEERMRAVGDPAPPEAPVTPRAACGYLFRRAVPALVPVVVAVVAQFVFTGPENGALTVLGVVAVMAGGTGGAAVALGRRPTALVAGVATAGLLVVPPMAVTGRAEGLFAVHVGLFGVVTLFVAAVCYVETAELPGTKARGSSRPFEP